MTRLPAASRRSMMTLSTALGLAILAPPSSAQQRPRRGEPAEKTSPQRFLAMTRETEDAKDGVTLIRFDARTWTPMAGEVGRGGRISWDGSRYAWCEGSPGEATATLWIVDLRGNRGVRKIPMEGLGGHCNWSPDGRELIVTTTFPREAEARRRTWRVSADGSKIVKLPVPTADMVWDWSRDGRWLVTTSARRSPGEEPILITREDVRLIRPDGAGDRLVHHLARSTRGDPRTIFRTGPPRFSPDGRSLLWQEAEGVGSDESRIIVKDLAGDKPREITRVGDARKRLAAVCWSPDSQSLALHIAEGSRRACDARFEIIDLKGRKIQTLDAGDLPDASKRAIISLMDWR